MTSLYLVDINLAEENIFSPFAYRLTDGLLYCKKIDK